MYRPSFKKIWLLLGAFMIGFVVFQSLVPYPGTATWFEGSDKTQHALAYLVLMFWFCSIYLQKGERLRLFVGFVVMGFLLEVVQIYIPDRFSDWRDGVANTVGILVGWLLAQTPLGGFLSRVERLFGR